MVQNYDLLRPRECRRQFFALAAVGPLDRGHDAGRSLEIEDRFLQLRVDDGAVRDDQHSVEDLFALGIVQVGQKMCGPGNGVRLARAG